MTAATTRRRRAAYRRGRLAETVAVWRLRLAGYRILARDVKTPVGEIDIVARRGGTLVFVEVKRRDSRAAAAESLSARQRQRILRAALWYVRHNPSLTGLAMRFDVILVAPWHLPWHLPAAWGADGLT